MKIFFKINEDTREYLATLLEDVGYSGPLVESEDNYHEYEVGISDFYKVHKTLPEDINQSYVFFISSVLEANKVFKMIVGETLVRFNSGKPEYSYIDFSLFDFLLKSCINPNDIVYSEKRDYVEMLHSCSTIVFESDKLSLQNAIHNLQVFGYRRSLQYVKSTIDSKSQKIDLEAFTPMADVLKFGAKKYARNNWRSPVENIESIVDSLERHIKCLMKGEDIDSDSKLPHIGHLMCNIMFLTYHLKKNGKF